MLGSYQGPFYFCMNWCWSPIHRRTPIPHLSQTSRIHIPIGYVRKQQLGFAFHGELINLIYPLKCNNPQDRLQGHLRMRWGYDACLKDGHARVRIEVQSEVRHLQVVGVSPTFWFHGLQNIDSIASQSHCKLIKFKWMGFSSSKLRKVDWLSLGICGL